MHTFDIIIKNNNPEYEDIVHHTYTFLLYLTDSGQILWREHLLVQDNNTITIAVACPEIDSLDTKNCNEYAVQYLQKIEEGTGFKIEFIETGTEPDYPFPRYDVPEKSSYYILRHGWSSALMCGDTEKCVPFYKIPYTDKLNTDYSNIWTWERDHQSLFRLWLGSQTITEEFALEQMQNADSQNSQMGRELCAKIEELTGVPTYYFLFNSRKWTVQEDLDRKCPLTNNEWRIEGKTASDFIAFKCDESRLVSELSHNCKDG